MAPGSRSSRSSTTSSAREPGNAEHCVVEMGTQRRKVNAAVAAVVVVVVAARGAPRAAAFVLSRGVALNPFGGQGLQPSTALACELGRRPRMGGDTTAKTKVFATPARRLLPLRTARFGLQMTDAAAASDSSEDGAAQHTDDPAIMVVDMESSRTIECFLDQRVRIGHGADKQEVLLCYPADVPVVIAKFDQRDELCQVAQAEERAVFETAKDHLLAKGLLLVQSAVCLTAQGDVEESFPSTRPETQQAESFDEDELTVRVLAVFEHEGEEYTITEPVDPVLIFAVTSAEAEEVWGQTEPSAEDARPKIFSKLLPQSQVADFLPQIEQELGKRFTQKYAGYGSKLGA